MISNTKIYKKYYRKSIPFRTCIDPLRIFKRVLSVERSGEYILTMSQKLWYMKKILVAVYKSPKTEKNYLRGRRQSCNFLVFAIIYMGSITGLTMTVTDLFNLSLASSITAGGKLANLATWIPKLLSQTPGRILTSNMKENNINTGSYTLQGHLPYLN